MAAAEHVARTVWTGDLQKGQGRVDGDSDAVKGVELTWSKRNESGATPSPEEFLAAALSSCLAMNVSGVLTKNGTPPEEIDVTARVGFGQKDGGFAVTYANVSIKGKVPGMSEDEFRKLAEQGEQTCPVATLFRGNTEQKVDIQFEG